MRLSVISRRRDIPDYIAAPRASANHVAASGVSNSHDNGADLKTT
jgi:hypothetical protein